jgi:hypothetical protein
MIEMQVRIDDEIHLLGLDAVSGELIEQARRAVDSVYVAALGVPFVAGAGFDEDIFSGGANQKTIHAQENAIAFVGGSFFLPHRLGDDTEHRAAIETQSAVGKYEKFQIAQSQVILRNPARAMISITAV